LKQLNTQEDKVAHEYNWAIQGTRRNE